MRRISNGLPFFIRRIEMNSSQRRFSSYNFDYPRWPRCVHSQGIVGKIKWKRQIDDINLLFIPNGGCRKTAWSLIFCSEFIKLKFIVLLGTMQSKISFVRCCCAQFHLRSTKMMVWSPAGAFFSLHFSPLAIIAYRTYTHLSGCWVHYAPVANFCRRSSNLKL